MCASSFHPRNSGKSLSRPLISDEETDLWVQGLCYLAVRAGPVSETKSTSPQGQVLAQIRNRKGRRAEGKRLGSAIRSWPKGGGCFWAWFCQMGLTQQPLQPGTNPFCGHWGPLWHAWYLSSSPLLLAQSLGFAWAAEAFHHQAVACLSRMSFPAQASLQHPGAHTC